MKRLAILDLDSITIDNPIEKARVIIERDKILQELKDFNQDKSAIDLVKELWKNFEEMLFNLFSHFQF